MSIGTNEVLSGISISPGLAAGRAFVFEDILERDLLDCEIGADEVDKECMRCERAIAKVLVDLSLSADRVEQELEAGVGDIFRAHEEMLRDLALIGEIRAEIEKGLVKSECALKRVLGRWERKFRTMGNDLLEQRGDDIADLARRLLRSLAGLQSHSLERMPKGSILVARKLLPSDTVFFSRRSVRGVVVERGGPGSHCALLTRQLGIPGVSRVTGLLDRVATGDLLLLDGLRGTVTIRPDQPGLTEFRSRKGRYYSGERAAKKLSNLPAVTRDGVAVPVMANIGNRHDAETAAGNGADGIGLFRIEIFFMARTMLPDEEELVAGMSKAIDPMKGKPVSIRLLDIGGDKQLPYLSLPSESDPFLGRRGVRFLLDYPDYLDLQLRALLRLSREHDVRIIVPMVTTVDDMRKVRVALVRVGSKLGFGTLPPLGAMVETPAAALCASEIAGVSDFLNIGSNDLTQYTMAAGRENSYVSRYFRDDHPAVFRLLKIVCSEAHGISVGLCGELAGRCPLVNALLGTGIGILSVPPPLVPAVKEAVRGCSTDVESVRRND
ncbi:MAG: phosphoenolpyruvate--protein phosphotransferase [Opitutaceae bacterium]